MARKKSQSTPRKITIMRRQIQAFELRLAGATFQQIADQMKYKSCQAAYNAYKAGLNMIVKEPAEEARLTHRERLERLFLSYYPLAKRGELGAGNMCIKILQEVAKIEGHYAPAQLEIDWRKEAEQLGLSAGEVFEEMVAHIMERTDGVEPKSDGSGSS